MTTIAAPALSATALGVPARTIKEWAAAQTPPLPTSSRGRLSTAVLKAYATAHQLPH